MPARFSSSSTSSRRCTSAFAAATAFSRSAIAALRSAFPGGAERLHAPQRAAAASAASNERARSELSLLIARSSLTAHGVLVVERWHVDAGIRVVRLARRPVRRHAAAERVVVDELLARVEPAALVRRDERRVPVELLDFPDAVLLHVFVLVRAFAPVATRSRAVDAGHQERAPARLGRLPVGRDGDDRLELEVLVEHALERSLLAAAQAQEIAADAVLADVDAARADLECAVVREQVEHLVPEHLVGVVAVAALEILERIDVGDARGAGLHAREPRAQRRDARGGIYRRLRARGEGSGAQRDA